MAYAINRFGSPDGATNNTFDITLIGKGFTNYGEIIQENLVHMLENFNRATPPSSPTPGQLWFNPTTSVLSVRTTAGVWKSLDDVIDGSVDNDSIAAGAAISLSKLASGTAGQIIVADSGGTPTYRTMSGDTTISDTGAVSIAANSVGASEIATAQVQSIHLDGSIFIPILLVTDLTASGLTLSTGANFTMDGLLTTSSLSVTASALIEDLNVSNLNVLTSASVHGAAVFASAGTALFNGTVTMTSTLIVTGSATINELSVSTFVTTGTATATYGDLAERYESDGTIELDSYGTVVMFGGTKEITISDGFMNNKVAGVVSEYPAFGMRNDFKTEAWPFVALQGRVPVKVVGPFEKGDMLVTASALGRAVSFQKTFGGEIIDPRIGTVIGKALETRTDDGPGSIMVAVGRH